MDSRAIRESFLAFFEQREHMRVPSGPLVPNDPSLLFTNAGMVPFKPYFQGEQSPPFDRATSSQKCMRAGGKHNDLEEVGKTARHLTFFEMLGNFSFGDYYKEKACPWAWELVTEGWNIEPDRLWVSVYKTDDEAFEIWRDLVGVRAERIIRRGEKDNFWSMGVAGPCGPCSEIYVDLGDAFGPASDVGPEANEERYLEIWNLVFMQNECNAEIEPVAELPKKNIDTGAGLERIAMVIQDVDNVFDTDVLGGMIERAAATTGKSYRKEQKIDVGLRILADHGRSLTFMIADGVLPSNEERGYVLRRIMRRAIRHARLIGHEDSVLPPLVERCVELMGDAFPEIAEQKDHIIEVASLEEERFSGTLKQGIDLLEEEIGKAHSDGGRVPGEVAFKLHDTFGFPVDLTREIAEEAGLSLDQGEFERLMTEQRERARAARRNRGAGREDAAMVALAEERGATDFLGYEHLSIPGAVVALSDGTEGITVAGEGDEIDIVLDRTAFYAEGGGQVGDRGIIRGTSGQAKVTDTQKVAGGLHVHRATVTSGEIALGDDVEAIVDPEFRAGVERAHTATHILHWTLRDRLGDHARQAGSLVEPGRLRFDFNHFDALHEEEVAAIGDEMQTKMLVDDGVRAFETSYDFARSIGAMAIFGEKYGDFVRVVEVGDYSKELCGGTHVENTSQIGPIVLTHEGSIGSNLRRVEALVGRDGLDYLERRARTLERAATLLKVSPDEVGERIERMLAHQKEMERRIAEIEKGAAEADAETLAASAEDVGGTRLVVARRDGDVDSLRSLAQTLKGKLGSAAVVLGTSGDGRANLVAAVTKDLAKKGISARDLLAPGAALLGGGAGGKPELAISGGPAADRIDQAIEAVAKTARDALST